MSEIVKLIVKEILEKRMNVEEAVEYTLKLKTDIKQSLKGGNDNDRM